MMTELIFFMAGNFPKEKSETLQTLWPLLYIWNRDGGTMQTSQTQK